ncbi:glutamine synthetase family protein [Rhodobacter capsulatus]|jgi:glutamine synthetase|uniref:Glutamine synthetase-5 n=1 Tax=Rhodobacter capsulatus (strain ATCC BAA-309 / NBRC 16581 / SB1003) TaxID=272942 RepID=D5AP04_RHOCB|nr:glutamine synthetase family protein [Rhodobacter capsulatus]ADE86509.1 glutamine synthetase-5 [Rhodobacter capsulatus SB 1003]ETD00744.1 glutamine synthetase [Rhodobacter capsulatus DE442]ETD75375.1 glutamine synthetase [Rhodobacter capsulatus R121]ETD85052.1 glutamine synthetase [Rhodobacter capsulatus B6]ETD85121.1 glutamine synthetase [Rhodobacter capsulatus YW1]
MSRKSPDWTALIPKAARDYIAGRRLDEVECIVADIAGVARGKAMPASKFAYQDRFYLPNSIFLQTITGEWADNPMGAFTEPDMVLTPDWSTTSAAPWTADITLQVIHDVFDQQGNPMPVAPRNVLKRVVALYEAEGLKPIVAPEMEFFLVARNLDPNQPIIPPMGRSGRRAAAKQAYSMSAVDEYGPVIDDIYDFAEAQGFEIDGILQEGGAGQVEINLAHGDPVALADQIFYFKRLIREAALRHDCFATFMAKPIEGEPGSAMHIHQSVIDAKTGRNIFSNPDGGESEAFLHFIAGMQTHLPAVVALLAPYVNSYRRYVPDFAAPINIEWGRDNRTTGLRVPISDPSGRRLENRLAGMDCNPYLGLAASMVCGYLGLKEKKMPRPECQGDAYMGETDLPFNLGDALDLFSDSGPVREALGIEFCTVYEAVKRNEYKEFLQVISPWEREHLLLNV